MNFCVLVRFKSKLFNHKLVTNLVNCCNQSIIVELMCEIERESWAQMMKLGDREAHKQEISVLINYLIV